MNEIAAQLITGQTGPKPGLDGAASPNAVLIAEDDPIFRRILESWFKRWDYRVTAVENGLDAWEALQREDAPQLAILDWMMPGMDGIELCRRIRGSEHGTYRYVLLLTAKDDKQDVIAGLEAGADDYLTKPFDVDELRARVRAGKRILDLQAALLRAHAALQFDAAHDRLTKVWNRGAILDLLKGEMERSRRTHDSLGIIMADVDFFKKVNDTYGHLVGDAVLQEVGQRLASALRIYDSVGRYGGEEFLIVVPGCDGRNLVVTAERLRRKIADQPVDTSAGPVRVTISLGLVAAHPNPAEPGNPEALVQEADTALYTAKARGRNRVEGAPATRVAGQGDASSEEGRQEPAAGVPLGKFPIG
jgi:two-component system cell cycle response regulator